MKSTHLFILQVCLLVAQPSFSQNGKHFQSFTTPGTYKFIVPKATTLLTVTLKGAGGWGGGATGGFVGTGGYGGFVTGDLPVKENEELVIILGANGGPGRSAAITAIMRDKVYLVLAAGGGNGSSHGGKGGNGGAMGSAGTVGSGTFSSGNSGMGASNLAGGVAGIAGHSGSSGTNGIALKGGTNNARAAGEGWGGAGWFGGGSSATYSSTFLSGGPYASGGGGGGSNYVKGLTGNIVSNATGSMGGVGNNMGIYGSVNISWK